MPSLYAHYRFGLEIFPGLPADVRRPIQRCRSLFDIGLQGPDFFFYHSYLSRTSIVELGSQFHQQSGLSFFTRCCAHVRENPSEEALAYLYGLLAHYCLDSLCHPFVYRHTEEGPVSHSLLETEFDRHLLLRQGNKKPHLHNTIAPLKLRTADYAVISGFYPGTTPEQIHRCIRSMRMAAAFLTAPEPLRYGVTGFLTMASENVRGMHMGKIPRKECQPLMEPLLAHFTEAIQQFPDYLEQFRDHLTYNAPLGERFTATFDH